MSAAGGAGEPTVAVASTPREWGPALQRHLADHGGAHLRATVLHPDDALSEDYDVFVADDATSFLTQRLVAELHRRRRAVVGVFDPDDPDAKDRLRDLAVDAVVERHASCAEIVAAVREVAPAPEEVDAELDEWLPAPPRTAPSGHVVAVVAASGGAGATEVAVGVAARTPDPVTPVLVDADDAAPALAQRLGVGLYPNLVAAVDNHVRGRPCLDTAGQLALGGRAHVIAGAPPETAAVRPDELAGVVTALASARLVVVNLAPTVQALRGSQVGERLPAAPAVLRRADAALLVVVPSPTGVSRAVEWMAAASDLVAPTRLHLVVNRSPADRYRRGEIAAELCRVRAIAGVWHLPDDPRVGRAAWDAAAVPRGAFQRALDRLAAALPCSHAPAPRRPGRWR